ncbi:glycosyltransferase family 87 protein [Hyphococcus sp.]|uniref:glycosyltransferase family 87 protein n=1 Tax=Hyphococcus sp. TaxID=2038636 RepID=UPI003751D01E
MTISPTVPEKAPNPARYAGRFPLLHGLFLNPSAATLRIAAMAALGLYTLIHVATLLTSQNFVTPDKSVVGGDFVVFWTAAKSLFADGAAALYQPDALNVRLDGAFPSRGGFSLFWVYPPSIYFLFAPLAALPYLPALWAWMAATTAMFGAAMLSLWRAKLPLLIALASAAAFQGWLTGQIGFITAALLVLAAGWADRRPMLAGIAAGLLTIKPQLGLLIPVAFAAAGCWRAFGAAAVTGVALAALSFIVLGAEAWVAFFDAFSAQSARMGEAIFPYHKLISPYGFAMTLGAPATIAALTQALATTALAAFVFLVWRRTTSWELRLIALLAAAPLATPYAFYYEAPIFIAALMMLAKLGIEGGWLKLEKQALIALWALPLLAPGPVWLPISAMLSFAAFALCARRVLSEIPLRPSMRETSSA